MHDRLTVVHQTQISRDNKQGILGYKLLQLTFYRKPDL